MSETVEVKVIKNEKVWSISVAEALNQLLKNHKNLVLSDTELTIETRDKNNKKIYLITEIAKLSYEDKQILILEAISEESFNKLVLDEGGALSIPTLKSLKVCIDEDVKDNAIFELYVLFKDIVDNEGNIGIRLFPLYADTTCVSLFYNDKDSSDGLFSFVISEDAEYFENPNIDKMNITEKYIALQVYERQEDILVTCKE